MSKSNNEPRKDLKQLSDEELDHYLELASNESIGRKLALEERARRRAKSKFRNLAFRIAAVVLILAVLVTILILLG